jgi:hypothetical protein
VDLKVVYSPSVLHTKLVQENDWAKN